MKRAHDEVLLSIFKGNIVKKFQIYGDPPPLIGIFLMFLTFTKNLIFSFSIFSEYVCKFSGQSEFFA